MPPVLFVSNVLRRGTICGLVSDNVRRIDGIMPAAAVLTLRISICRYYTVIRGDHIHYIISPTRGGDAFLELYDNIFDRCRNRLKWESLNGLDGVDAVCRCLRECLCQVS